jgi:uncharacterized repeat protein (TIGR01451 family)
MSKLKIGMLILLVFSLGTPLLAQLNVIYDFGPDMSLGYYPRGTPVVVGSTLYGTTVAGGPTGLGLLFSVNTNGSGFQVLHYFEGGESDGTFPLGTLSVSGDTLYGTTTYGGAYDCGTIFKINTDGTGFALVHSFAGAPSDGGCPKEAPVLDGSTLFGVAFLGGDHDLGVVYKVEMDGTNFAILHSFGAEIDDGASPAGELVQDGSTLYGMTTRRGFDGSTGPGAVFRIGTDGSGFQVLHFLTNEIDGFSIYGSLVLGGSTLYGMTFSGGPGSVGFIFSVGTDGNDYKILHNFGVEAADNGAEPCGSLLLSGSTLYGLTEAGGTANLGTLFSIGTDGQAFVVLHSFVQGEGDGTRPEGGLTADDDRIYGMTAEGGASDLGTVFAYGSSSDADMALDLEASNLTPTLSTEIDLTIRASNNGPSTATGVKVMDRLPAGLTYRSSKSFSGRYDPGTGLWTIGSLGAHQAAVLHIAATVNTSGTIVNTAAKTAQNEADSNAANNSRSVTLRAISQSTLFPPVLRQPLNNAAGQPTTVTLNWQDTNSNPQAVKNKIRIKKAGGSYVNYTLPAGTTSFVKSGLAKGKTYCWSVQAVGNGTSIKNSAWPADRKFATIK